MKPLKTVSIIFQSIFFLIAFVLYLNCEESIANPNIQSTKKILVFGFETFLYLSYVCRLHTMPRPKCLVFAFIIP